MLCNLFPEGACIALKPYLPGEQSKHQFSPFLGACGRVVDDHLDALARCLPCAPAAACQGAASTLGGHLVPHLDGERALPEEV